MKIILNLNTIKMKRLQLLILGLIITNGLFAINITDSIISGGVWRKFIIHSAGTNVAANLPVMYVLHGDGGTGAGIKSYSGFDSIADQNNFMSVYPNSHQAGGLWNKYVDFAAGDGGTGNSSAVDDVQFFSDLTTHLCSTYNINASKVYATGHSGGAFMCYNLALQLPNKIAGIAPVAGSCWGNNTALNTIFTSASYTKVPIYHIHGDADFTVSYPDPNHTPGAWAEWPFSSFGYYGCGNNTYTSTTNLPGTGTAGSVKKLTFCTGPASTTNKEVFLIRMVGGGHGWPNAAGYKPAKAIWDFCNQYALTNAVSCTNSNTPINGNVIGGIVGPNNNFYIHTSGKYILGPQGDTVILRGVNYAPYNWGWDNNELRINEIAKSNANAVRLVWYVNGGGAPHYANWTLLDSAISKCVQAGMVVIPELHNQTCTQDSAGLTSLLNWWTNPNMLNILNKYQGYIIVNYANEALGSGAWSWLGGSPTAYKNIYANIITQLRSNLGFNYPIMIDAPDCGSNENAILTNSVASYLNSIDPLHNIIYSVHTYWTLPTNNSSVLKNRITSMQNSIYPFVLGEVAATSSCSDVILLDSILKFAKQADIGWLAWSWDRDNCAARQLTTNGLFANLTPVGNTLVNNTQYGMMNTAVKILPFLSMPLEINKINLSYNNCQLHWLSNKDVAITNLESSEDGINFNLHTGNLTNNSVTIPTNTSHLYYRIKEVLTNNLVVISNIVRSNCKLKAITITPNPCIDYIQIHGISKLNNVNIFSLQGHKKLAFKNVKDSYSVDIKSLVKGLYIVEIISEFDTNYYKLLKE
jgi:poly(3-hydroxybutyrate) depolymerase